jgi:hypothetical protein
MNTQQKINEKKYLLNKFSKMFNIPISALDSGVVEKMVECCKLRNEIIKLLGSK